jgi:hypothetical protein
MVQADIAPAKELLNEFLAIDITTAPRMSDSAHIFAMKLMTTLWTYLFLSKPEFLLTISFRMLKISKGEYRGLPSPRVVVLSICANLCFIFQSTIQTMASAATLLLESYTLPISYKRLTKTKT